jgi:hypothetical protein
MWLPAALARLAEQLTGTGSAWERLRIEVPARAFGPGSELPFADYFQGESSVRVRSIDDIVAWLQTCEYAPDVELFQKRDYWQHPAMFEQRRCGDCEDFALWAWRKLTEIGIDAEFCVGGVICEQRPRVARQHAWVLYQQDATTFLFEPAARLPSKMICRLEDVMSSYVPHFAINHRFETTAFAGCTTPLQAPVEAAQ